jgi:hypothetical protein
MAGYRDDLGYGASGKSKRVTAVPLRSLKVTPTIPTALQAFFQEDRKPLAVQGFPSELTKMMGLRFVVLSRAECRGPPTGITTRAPVFDCLSLICVPS